MLAARWRHGGTAKEGATESHDGEGATSKEQGARSERGQERRALKAGEGRTRYRAKQVPRPDAKRGESGMYSNVLCTLIEDQGKAATEYSQGKQQHRTRKKEPPGLVDLPCARHVTT